MNDKMMRSGLSVSLVTMLLALSAGASLQDECQRLADEAVASGEQGAVQFCAYKNGKCIVDVCAGRLSTNENATAVRPDSLFPIFSTEKPLLATAVHRAVEKGKMSYDKPLCTWWPELTGKGKERLTLRETLGYRTGLNGGRPKCYTNDIEYCDWERTWRAAAVEDPEIEPGTKQRYLPRAYAWMLGHPLEVAMGKPASRVLEEEILRPAGIAKEFYFIADDSVFPRIATVYCSKYTAFMNEAWARHAFLPSSFAVASARAVAKFYNRLCGYDGKPPLIRPETLEAALKPCRHPSDPLPDAETMKRDWFMIFGMGYGLWGDAERIGRVFGHGGAGGSEGLVDRDQKLVVAFTCNFDNYKGGLRQRLYDAVGMWWRYSKDRDADIQTLQMRTKDRK